MIEREIGESLSNAAVLEQLAEEAAELAQAALKLARILRGENPTPKTAEEAAEHLSEEAADVLVCMDVLVAATNYLTCIDETVDAKKMRWLERLKKQKEMKIGSMNNGPAARYVDKLIEVDVAPVVHGEWLLKHIGMGHHWECSVCHTNLCIYVTENTKFCPNCGAKMDGGKHETD